MAIIQADLKWHISGGTNNENPFKSLGGNMSNDQVRDDQLNNLWDDVTPRERKDGDKEFRIIYLRNKNTADTANVKVWFGENDSYMSMASGPAGAGTPEPLLTDESIDPGTGSPGGPTREVLIETVDDKATSTANFGTTSQYPRVGEKITGVSHPAYLQLPMSLGVKVGRTGNVAGTIKVEILDGNRTVKATSNSIDAITVPLVATGARIEQFTKFTFSSPVQLNVDDYIIVRHDGATASVGVLVAFADHREHWGSLPVTYQQSQNLYSFHPLAQGKIMLLAFQLYVNAGACTQTQTNFETLETEPQSYQKPINEATAINLGSIPPNSFKSLILVRTIPKEAQEQMKRKFTLVVKHTTS